MMKFNKNIWFFYWILIFLLIFNVSFIFNITPVLQLSAIFGLLFLPGYLFSLSIQMGVKDRIENFFLIIGLSVVIDIILGLIINSILPFWGINNPLSSQNLELCISFMIFVSSILIIYLDHVPEISLKRSGLKNIEKCFLIFGLVILLCCLAGVYFVNAENSNILLMVSIIVIPLFFAIIIFFHEDNRNEWVYPLVVFLMSLALILIFSLRSNFIIGIDSSQEYFLFHQTFTQSSWIPDPSFLLSASLSISILPTIFENIIQSDPQLLFKILYPGIFSITPVIIYLVTKKYVNNLLAIFAACFFMFQKLFIITSENSRTAIAILFIALAILTVLNKDLSYPKKKAILFLFIAGIIVSHYTSALIFFIILFIMYLLIFAFEYLCKERDYPVINLLFLFMYAGMIFFWFEEIINQVFIYGLRFVVLRLDIFNDLVHNDVSKYVAPPASLYTSFIPKIANYSRWALYSLIGIGVLLSVYMLFQKAIKRNSLPKFFIDIDAILVFSGVVSFGLLVISFFAAYLIFGYDTGRLGELIFVFLSVFLIIGSLECFCLFLQAADISIANRKSFKNIRPLIDYCMSHKTKIVSFFLLILLIPQLFFAIGITNQFFGGPYSIMYNSPKFSQNTEFGSAYIFNQDADALQWFNNTAITKNKIFSDDYGNNKITVLLGQPSLVYQNSIIQRDQSDISMNYIFSSVADEYYERFIDFNGHKLKISSYDIYQKDKIYANGAVIYR